MTRPPKRSGSEPGSTPFFLGCGGFFAGCNRRLAERAAASDDVDVRLLGRKARLYLATLPGETMDLDAVRLEIVEKILALRAALGDDPAPAVAATKEGDAK